MRRSLEMLVLVLLALHLVRSELREVASRWQRPIEIEIVPIPQVEPYEWRAGEI